DRVKLAKRHGIVVEAASRVFSAD
ncbi:MAG TPA: histone deacetylase, partial [Marinobacter adhaerens]|nr:histone deacetylase [Marinobacter adhaerens]